MIFLNIKSTLLLLVLFSIIIINKQKPNPSKEGEYFYNATKKALYADFVKTNEGLFTSLIMLIMKH